MSSLTRPAAPQGFRKIAYDPAGIAFEAPRNWTLSYSQTQPLVIVTSGTAVVAVWRYPRSKQLPSSPAQLARAGSALIDAARLGDRRLRLIRSQFVTLAGAPAVVLNTTEEIAGIERRVRSIHIFAPGAELVIEEYAPPGVFHSVDHQVFSPLKRSLALLSPSAT